MPNRPHRAISPPRAMLGLAALLASAAPALAQSPASQTPPQTGIWDRATLLGDAGGLRTLGARAGVTLGVNETSEVLGNVAGGVRQGATYDGVTTATLQIDTAKAFGLPGGLFNASALQLHGRSLSPIFLDNLQSASGIAGDNATRLWELWYQQSFLSGRADIRIGQQSIDQEFIVSRNSNLFVNTMAGWPMLPTADLYGGGPAYPLASLGVRLRARLDDADTFLVGVFDDNPQGGGFSTATAAMDASGTRFNLGTGALMIAEWQHGWTPPSGLDGTYKLGGWVDGASFPDQAYDNHGISLASPASDGIPAARRGNFSLYAVIDQTIWKPTPGAARGVNLFARIMGAPGDRNLIDFSFNGGLTLTDPLPGRANDTAGIDVGIAKVSGGASALDRATGYYTARPYPVRSAELLVELTYQYQAAPWWQIQPVVQYIVNPGGGIPNPVAPQTQLRNELVLGVRISISF